VTRRPAQGILPYQQITRLITAGTITAPTPIEDRQIQPASLDLRLGKKAYRLISSFLPELSAISSRLDVMDFYQSDLVMYEMDLSGGAILEKGHVYLVPLLESLRLPATIRARANPKSTTGRLDVFTRIVTDLNAGFDEIRAGYQGPLFLEVVPRSFAIKVKTGQSLNQIRFVRGEAAPQMPPCNICIVRNPSSTTTCRTASLFAKGNSVRIAVFFCASTSRATSAPILKSSGTEPRKTVM
jgi:dCTP deaminase